MPLTRLSGDAFGVVIIVLVSLITVLGLLSIFFIIYFRHCIRQQALLQLGYFNGPWIIRITLILITIWWGLGEIVRLTFLKGSGGIFHALTLKWQENVCKFYILSNLGFAEPTLFLILVLLLHASLQRRELGTLSQRWSGKIFSYLLLFCFPVFVAQLFIILIGPKLKSHTMLPKYFTNTSASSLMEAYTDSALCIYPLLNTIVHGLFSVVLTVYLVYIGAQMAILVINKGLRRRVYLLTFCIVTFLPLRVLFLGFSVLSYPGHFAYELLVFLAFFMFSSCAVVGFCVLVYYPVADSLAVMTLQRLGSRCGQRIGRGLYEETTDSIIADQSLLAAGSNASEGFDELSIYAGSDHRLLSPSGSSLLPERPMIPLRELSDYELSWA